MVYKNNNWKMVTKSTIINDIYDDKKYFIEENFEKYCDKLSQSKRNSLNRWLKTDDDDKNIKKIKEKMLLSLYNNKHIPIKNINKK